jgi:hypothetical protein
LVPIGAARIGHSQEAQAGPGVGDGDGGAGLGAALVRPQQPTPSRHEGGEEAQQSPSLHGGSQNNRTSLADRCPGCRPEQGA